MGLSEREQRILDEIEVALAAEGPIKVVDPKHKIFLVGVLVGLLGMILLLAAVIIPFPPLGVLAFIVMLTGVSLSIRSLPLRR